MRFLEEHPWKIQPTGNRLFFQGDGNKLARCDDPNSSRRCCRWALGPLFQALEVNDTLFLTILGFLNWQEILSSIHTLNAAWYILGHTDEVWKPWVLQQFKGHFYPASSTWFATFAHSYAMHFSSRNNKRLRGEQDNRSRLHSREETEVDESFRTRYSPSNVLDTKPVCLYSDVLYHGHHCTFVPLKNAWLNKSNIDRVTEAECSVQRFREVYEERGRPVIFTDVVTKWPAFTKWTPEYLIKSSNFPPPQPPPSPSMAKPTTAAAPEAAPPALAPAPLPVEWSAGGYAMNMQTYFEYTQFVRDDQPLYIFDKQFAEKIPPLLEDYTVPSYFQDDLFALLTETHEKNRLPRPDFRWLIVGPSRSGSSFHVDPNATSAWNAVVRGKKKWILFPPEHVPPGVHPSEDGDEVATPVSLVEWFLSFYAAAVANDSPCKPFEAIVEAGEMIFVPSGYWHLVLNLEDSIALTQNYVSFANLSNVLDFLEFKPQQISGLPTPLSSEKGANPLLQPEDLYAAFVDKLEKHHPQQLRCVQNKRKERARQLKQQSGSLWTRILAGQTTSALLQAAGEEESSVYDADTKSFLSTQASSGEAILLPRPRETSPSRKPRDFEASKEFQHSLLATTVAGTKPLPKTSSTSSFSFGFQIPFTEA